MNLRFRSIVLTAIALLPATQTLSASDPTTDRDFEKPGEQQIDQFAAFSPIGATSVGDHHFDGQLDQQIPLPRRLAPASN